MTVIALLDTESSLETVGGESGLIDCMVGLPEGARAPGVADFTVATSGVGSAEVVGVAPLAGQRRNAYRLTLRFAVDAGLLSIRYRAARASRHGKAVAGPIDLSVRGFDCRSTIDAGGGEWHFPASDFAPGMVSRPASEPESSGLEPRGGNVLAMRRARPAVAGDPAVPTAAPMAVAAPVATSEVGSATGRATGHPARTLGGGDVGDVAAAVTGK